MKSIFLCFSGLISIVFIWTNINFMVYGGVRDFVQLIFLALSVVLVLASFFFTQHKLKSSKLNLEHTSEVYHCECKMICS